MARQPLLAFVFPLSRVVVLPRGDHTARAREGLAAGFATRTANYGLCALRGVLKECWRLGLMSHEEFRRATDLAAVRGDNTAAGRVLTVEELLSQFRVCAEDDSPKGIRDSALLAVLYSTGLRRSEWLALNVADYKDGVLTVRREPVISCLATELKSAASRLWSSRSAGICVLNLAPIACSALRERPEPPVEPSPQWSPSV